MLTLLPILLFVVAKLRHLLLLYFPVHVSTFVFGVVFLLVHVMCFMILISSDLIVINPGDEVIIFDPSFDTYANVVSIAGGVPVSYRVSRLKLIPLISKTDFPADFELIMNRYM